MPGFRAEDPGIPFDRAQVQPHPVKLRAVNS